MTRRNWAGLPGQHHRELTGAAWLHHYFGSPHVRGYEELMGLVARRFKLRTAETWEDAIWPARRLKMAAPGSVYPNAKLAQCEQSTGKLRMQSLLHDENWG